MSVVALGYSFLALCIGLGLGAIFTKFPVLNELLKIWRRGLHAFLAWKSRPRAAEGRHC